VGGDDDRAAVGGQPPAEAGQLDQRLGLVAADAPEVEDELARPADRRVRGQVVDVPGDGELPARVDDARPLAEPACGGDVGRGDRQRHGHAGTRDSSP
jgi:hypothetical protein